jgi:hypothetical protein
LDLAAPATVRSRRRLFCRGSRRSLLLTACCVPCSRPSGIPCYTWLAAPAPAPGIWCRCSPSRSQEQMGGEASWCMMLELPAVSDDGHCQAWQQQQHGQAGVKRCACACICVMIGARCLSCSRLSTICVLLTHAVGPEAWRWSGRHQTLRRLIENQLHVMPTKCVVVAAAAAAVFLPLVRDVRIWCQ